MNIEIIEVSRKYTLSLGKYRITAKKFADGRITLKTFKNDREFIFVGSKKEDIEAVASLMIEASKI